MSEVHPSPGVGSSPATAFGTGSARILVVDDEIFITSLIAEMLEQDLKKESVQVFSAEEAIEELQRGEFSLVISDIRMPGIGGFGLLEWIEAKRPDLKQRFLFMTGYAGGPESEQTLARLGTPVMQKPFSCSDLLDRCRGVLSAADSAEDEVQGRCCLAA